MCKENPDYLQKTKSILRRLYDLQAVAENFDKLLWQVNNEANESVKATIWGALAIVIAVGPEEAAKTQEYNRSNSLNQGLHHLAHVWSEIFDEVLWTTNRAALNDKKTAILLSLTSAFRGWVLLSTCPEQYESGLLRKISETQPVLLSIARIQDVFWKARALALFSKLIEALVAGDANVNYWAWLFDRALHEFDELVDDLAKERLLAGIEWRFGHELRMETYVGVGAVPAPPPEMAPPPSLPEIVSFALPALFAPHNQRYADFTFYAEDPSAPKQKLPTGAPLQAEKWYQLEVAIRIKPQGVPPAHWWRRPLREPKQTHDVTIMVTAEGDGFEIEEPVQTLMLPPQGNSTKNAWFRVRALHPSPTALSLASIKVQLYYEFNLLEVVVIKAEAVGKFVSAAQSQFGLAQPIFFNQARLEREYLDFDNIYPKAMHVAVDKKEGDYLLNFLFRNDANEALTFTAPAHLVDTDLEDALMEMRKTWYGIAMSKTFTQQLEGDQAEFLENIHKLAELGRMFWNKLFKRESGSALYKVGAWLEAHPLKKDSIIQITLTEAAANFVFPWALIYDQEYCPTPKYKLPNLEGFWGVRYAIEQQLPGCKDADAIPAPSAGGLKLAFMLWEQFKNAEAEKRMLEKLTSECRGKLRVSVPPITRADVCKVLLGNCDAQILYFYTHGHTKYHRVDANIDQSLNLFVSWYEALPQDSELRGRFQSLYKETKQADSKPNRSWIELSFGKVYLDDLYPIESLTSQPFVILNMCESAQITPSLSEGFVKFFLDRGAKGVLGTECPMTIEFAHPFAEKFLAGLLAGKQVGQVLLEIRRHFLNYKNPLGLAYTLFGSAVTRFEPPLLSPL